MQELEPIVLPPLSVIDGVAKIKGYGKMIQNLRFQRNNSRTISYESGKRHLVNVPERSVHEITDEIDFWSRKQRELVKAVTQANGGFMSAAAQVTNFIIPGESEPLTLGQLVLFLKQLRDGLSWLKQLYEVKTTVQSRERKVPSGVPGVDQREEYFTITEVLYNPKNFEVRYKRTEKMIEAAQRTLNGLNENIKLNFAEEDYIASEEYNSWFSKLEPPAQAFKEGQQQQG